MSTAQSIEERVRVLEAKFRSKPYARDPKVSEGAEQEIAVFPRGDEVRFAIKYKGKWMHLGRADRQSGQYLGHFAATGEKAQEGGTPPGGPKPPGWWLPENNPFNQPKGMPPDFPPQHWKVINAIFGKGYGAERFAPFDSRQTIPFTVSTAVDPDGESTWPGHFAEAVYVTNDTAFDIPKGAVCTLVAGQPNEINVALRTGLEMKVNGVALEDIAKSGGKGLMAISGFCDVLLNGSWVLGDYYALDSGDRWKVETDATATYATGEFRVGVSLPTISGYPAGYVRLQLRMYSGSASYINGDLVDNTTKADGYSLVHDSGTLEWKPRLDPEVVSLNDAYNYAYDDHYSEMTFSGITGYLTNVDIWEDSGKSTKLYSKTLSWTGDKLTTVTIVDEQGTLTMTKTLTWDGDELDTVTTAVT